MNIRPPPNSEAIRASLQAMQRFSHHDAHAKEMIDHIPSQPVWVQDPYTRTWYEGAIVSKAETPRSYICAKSGIVRRNRIHLKERRIPAVKDQKVVKVAGKANGGAKGTSNTGKCK